MKEVLYDIPVNDIFNQPCECPICAMKKKLDEDAVSFAMGPSYMEDDIRMATDEIGFCKEHIQMMYQFGNRLGLALILDTHMKSIIKNVEQLQKKGRSSSGLFSKKTDSGLSSYIKKTSHSCYLCDRIHDMFERYVITTICLYEKDMTFRTKFKECSGFCLEHYGVLFELAPSYLQGQTLEEFTNVLNQLFLTNYKRVEEDVSWFIDKFDYRNTNSPWKTSKDALPRAITKVNGILPNEEDAK